MRGRHTYKTRFHALRNEVQLQKRIHEIEIERVKADVRDLYWKLRTTQAQVDTLLSVLRVSKSVSPEVTDSGNHSD